MQSGSEQSRKEENGRQPRRGSFMQSKTSQQARCVQTDAHMHITILVSSEGIRPFEHLNEAARLNVMAVGVYVTALACRSPALPLAAGACSERSYSSRLVSQWLPWSLNHRVLHSLVARCFRLPRATPNQTEGRKKVRIRSFSHMCLCGLNVVFRRQHLDVT